MICYLVTRGEIGVVGPGVGVGGTILLLLVTCEECPGVGRGGGLKRWMILRGHTACSITFSNR